MHAMSFTPEEIFDEASNLDHGDCDDDGDGKASDPDDYAARNEGFIILRQPRR